MIYTFISVYDDSIVNAMQFFRGVNLKNLKDWLNKTNCQHLLEYDIDAREYILKVPEYPTLKPDPPSTSRYILTEGIYILYHEEGYFSVCRYDLFRATYILVKRSDM